MGIRARGAKESSRWTKNTLRVETIVTKRTLGEARTIEKESGIARKTCSQTRASKTSCST